MDNIEYSLIDTEDIREILVDNLGEDFEEIVSEMPSVELMDYFVQIAGERLSEIVDDALQEMSAEIAAEHDDSDWEG